MDDYEMEAERARNVGTNMLLIVAGLFGIGAVVLREGVWANPLVQYMMWGVTGILIMVAILFRFSKVSNESEYV